MAKVNKKGLFFTIGALFIVSLILILSVASSKTIRDSSTRYIESATLDRTYNIQKSLERTVRKLDTGVNITITNSTIGITEHLSGFNDKFQNLLIEIAKLNTHLNENEQGVILSLTNTSNATHKLPILIKPHNIEYVHKKEGSDLTLEIKTNTYINNYEIGILLNNELIDQEKNIEWITQNSGSDITLTIKASDYSSYETQRIDNIAYSEENLFKIGTTYIRIGNICNGCIEIFSSSADITTTFTSNLPFLEKMVTAEYPGELININLPGLTVETHASVRIA